MKIVINGRFLLPRLEGIGHYTYQLIDHLSTLYPDDEYHVVLDRSTDFDLFERKNVHPYFISPPARHPILWYYWFEFALPKLLKKINPDAFFSPDGFLSLKSDVPTLLTIHDLAYLHYPKGSQMLHRQYLHKFLPKYLNKAKAIACVSAFTRNDLVGHFSSVGEKSKIVYNGVSPSFQPLGKKEIADCRNRISRGHPYFLFLGSIHPRKNVARLIESFGQYKSVRKDNMILLLAGRMAWKSENIQRSIAQSSVKDSIIFLDTLYESIPEIVGSAFCMCYPSLFEGFGLPVVEAMAAGTPTITSANSPMEEIGGQGALYINPQSVSSITDGLLEIANNGVLRKSLIEEGKKQARLFKWEESAKKIHQILSSIAKRSHQV